MLGVNGAGVEEADDELAMLRRGGGDDAGGGEDRTSVGSLRGSVLFRAIEYRASKCASVTRIKAESLCKSSHCLQITVTRDSRCVCLLAPTCGASVAVRRCSRSRCL